MFFKNIFEKQLWRIGILAKKNYMDNSVEPPETSRAAVALLNAIAMSSRRALTKPSLQTTALKPCSRNETPSSKHQRKTAAFVRKQTEKHLLISVLCFVCLWPKQWKEGWIGKKRFLLSPHRLLIGERVDLSPLFPTENTHRGRPTPNLLHVGDTTILGSRVNEICLEFWRF